MHKTSKGFTLVELIIVIIVIGILSTIGIISFSGVQAKARDSQRASQVNIIADALEKYYNQNGEYPSCINIVGTATTNAINTLKGLDSAVLAAPGASVSNSIKCTDSPSYIEFGYVTNTSSCTSNACPEWTIKYKNELTNTTTSINSRHNSNDTLPPTGSFVMSISPSGSYVVASITTSPTCSNGQIPQYRFRNQVNNNSWSAYSDWSNILSSQQAIVAGSNYIYESQAHCVNSGNTINTSAAYLSAPSAPANVRFDSYDSSYLTFKWDTVSCGNAMAKYEYYYQTNNPDYTSSIYTVSSASGTSQKILNSGSYTYTFYVRSVCYLDAYGVYSNPSGWINVSKQLRPADPTTVVFSNITRTTFDSFPAIVLSASSSCDSSSYLYSKLDAWLDGSSTWGSWQWNFRTSGTAIDGWWRDSHSGLWFSQWYQNYYNHITEDFGSYGNTITLQVTSSPILPSGMPWRMDVQMYCQNPTTGVISNTIDQTSYLTVP